jgi:hypothetical protein
VRDPADGTRVTLHWLAAASDLPITGYRATAEPGGRSCTTGGELSCTITGLTLGVDYSFTVVAINGMGSSGPSGPVELPGDTVAPTVTGTAGRPANSAGWYRAPVTITWTATDPPPSSGTATTPSPTTLSTEGAGQFAVSGRSCDPAANCATGAYGPVNIDATTPTVTIAGAVNGATYALSQLPHPSCATSDATSGLRTAASLASTRDTHGNYTATCSGGTDNAGNTASPAAISYTVTPTTGDLTTLTNQYVTGSGSPNRNGVIHDLDNKLAHDQICLYIGKADGETRGPHPTLTTAQAAELIYWARILDPTC